MPISSSGHLRTRRHLRGTLAVGLALVAVLAATALPAEARPSIPLKQTSGNRRHYAPRDLTGLRIVVDLSDQYVYVFNKWGRLRRFAAASTGADGGTPTGRFHVYSKTRAAQSFGAAWMPYMSRFNGGIGFHGIPRVGTSPLPTPLGVAPVSHGCIRLADENAKWIYDNVPVGTEVTVQD